MPRGHRARLLPFVEVTWRDSHTTATTAWRDMEQAEEYHGEPCECSTVGYLIKRDRRGITLAMSVTQGGLLGALWHVPRGLVRRVRRLRARR